MKTVTVRDLRYHFSDLEARLRRGEEIIIRKRKQPVARLVPITRNQDRVAYPDFAAQRREIFGDKVLPVAVAGIVSWNRGER